MKLDRRELLCSLCYIDGQWIDGGDGRRISVVDPASGVGYQLAGVVEFTQDARQPRFGQLRLLFERRHHGKGHG